MCLKGVLFKLLAIHALEDDGNELLLKRYAKARGGYERLPRADSKSEKDRGFRSLLDYLEQNATEYCSWARSEDYRPLFRESIVTVCVALESALKEIAVAVRLGFTVHETSDPPFVFVPGKKLRDATKKVNRAWNSPRHDFEALGKVCSFASLELYADLAPFPRDYCVPELTADSEIVSVCKGAFELRNALVHNLGRPDHQIVIGEETFHPGFAADPRYLTLRTIQAAFTDLVAPFDKDDIRNFL